MKSYLLIILFFCSISLAAQNYHPFPTKNAMWTEMYYRPYTEDITREPEFHCYALKDQDTILNGKLYHKIYHSVDTIFTEEKLCGGIREENKRIYFYPIDSIDYPGQLTYPSKKAELVLYDFSLEEGDSIDSYTFRLSPENYPSYLLKVFKIDSILIGQKYRKAFHFGRPNTSIPMPWAIWVEGIGSLRGLLFPTGEYPENGLWSDLDCFNQENINLYHNLGYDNCFCFNNTGISINYKYKKPIIKPNPIQTKAIVDFNGNTNSRLKLVNLFGVVSREYNVKGMTSIEIAKENLSSGIYLLVIEDFQGNFSTAKLIFE